MPSALPACCACLISRMSCHAAAGLPPASRLALLLGEVGAQLAGGDGVGRPAVHVPGHELWLAGRRWLFGGVESGGSGWTRTSRPRPLPPAVRLDSGRQNGLPCCHPAAGSLFCWAGRGTQQAGRIGAQGRVLWAWLTASLLGGALVQQPCSASMRGGCRGLRWQGAVIWLMGHVPSAFLLLRVPHCVHR